MHKLPCYTEMILTELEQIVSKPEQEVAQKKKISQKKLKKQGWHSGSSVEHLSSKFEVLSSNSSTALPPQKKTEETKTQGIGRN
jgi:hypothetical protein